MKTFIRNAGLALMIAATSGAAIAGKTPSPGQTQTVGSVVITPVVVAAIANAVITQTTQSATVKVAAPGGGTTSGQLTVKPAAAPAGASRAVSLSVSVGGGAPVTFTASLAGNTVTITNSAGAVVETYSI